VVVEAYLFEFTGVGQFCVPVSLGPVFPQQINLPLI